MIPGIPRQVIVFTMPAGASLCPGFVGIPVLPVLLPHPADRCRHSQCRCSRSPRSGLSLIHIFSLVVEKGGSGSTLASIAADILRYYFSAEESREETLTENTLIR